MIDFLFPGGAETDHKQITIAEKSRSAVIIPKRRDALLKQADYMEAQAGRLAKMARDLRALILQLTTE